MVKKRIRRKNPEIKASQSEFMSKPSSAQLPAIIDDLYSAYFKLLSAGKEQEIEDILSEYAAPSDADPGDRGDGIEHPSVKRPQPKTFRRAA